MELSTFALLMGALELLVGLPMLARPAATTEWLIRLMKTEPTYRLVGAAFFAIGLLPLVDSCAPTFDVAGLIRLVALVVVVKSLIICWWPSQITRFTEARLGRSLDQRLMGLMATIAGVLFLMAACELRLR